MRNKYSYENKEAIKEIQEKHRKEREEFITKTRIGEKNKSRSSLRDRLKLEVKRKRKRVVVRF